MKIITLKIHGLTIKTFYLEIATMARLTLQTLSTSASQAYRMTIGQMLQDLTWMPRFEAYYSARVPDLHAVKVAGATLWAGQCPMCLRLSFVINPGNGFWGCEGPCNHNDPNARPVELEYLLSGEPIPVCENRVRELMGLPILPIPDDSPRPDHLEEGTHV